MRLSVEQLTPFGEDGALLHFVDTAFLESPDVVGVAVSGGGDSMALLFTAHRKAELAGTRVEAVTVNHGLRPEAANEAAFVARFCKARGIPHDILHWDGRAAEGNLAAAGRDARYALIADWAKGRGIGHVILGHTMDDVAETFLMRLARASGVDGLAAMDAKFERHGIQWARPFWQHSRAQLREYLQRNDVAWIDDPSNDDPTRERVKARKVLAALEPLGISVDTLKSSAHALAMARSAVASYTVEEARRLVTEDRGDIILPLRPRPPVHVEVERRLHRAAVQMIGGAAYPPRAMAMINLDVALMEQDQHTIGGCLVMKSEKEVRFTRELNACAGPIAMRDPGEGVVWDGRWRVTGPPDESAGLTVAALGDALSQVPNWREVGLPRASLMASPGVFDGDALVSAPIAGFNPAFEARIVADFVAFLLSR
ncbi:MAG: tRNA lysidine(34) synthetase TilS [Pseudomonadota bacterium]